MAMTSDQYKDRAERLLVNYFKAIAKKAGMEWEPDYTAEIAVAVDDIVCAAVEEMQEILGRAQDAIASELQDIRELLP